MTKFHTIRLLALVPLICIGLQAQTAMPSTTLCASITDTATSICLASTTNVVNQTGVYVDQEYMTVLLANNQTIAATNAYVPVSRANRAGAGPPTAHANSAVAWLALTPDKSRLPGVNGFVYSTQFGDVGPCTRTAVVYLPHIWPDRAVKRDCTTAGSWVDFAPEAGLDNPSPSPINTLAASAALSVSSGNYYVTKGTAAALTLAAPTAGVQDGMLIKITSTTAAAHTLVATTLIESGGSGSPYTTATFGAFIGSSITLRAYGGVWYVVTSSSITLS